MRTKALKSVIVATAATTLFIGLGVGPAFADAITFTWDPVGGGISALIPPNPSAAFSANNMTVTDYASISIPANPTIAGSVAETGYLGITQFNFVGAPGFAPGFTATNQNPLGASGGATPYQLYYQFTSTSHLAPSGGGLSGAFDSLNFTLYGDVGGNCKFSISGTTPTAACGGDTQVALANGMLAPGVNNVSIDAGLPAAHVTTTFNELVSGFFVSPPSTVTLDLEASFTNTSSVTSGNPSGCDTSGALPCTILINGGGGNATLQNVPEPGTLAMFGLGLLGLGFLGRRRSKQS